MQKSYLDRLRQTVDVAIGTDMDMGVGANVMKGLLDHIDELEAKNETYSRAMKAAEHKIDQVMQGQDAKPRLSVALWVLRDALSGKLKLPLKRDA